MRILLIGFDYFNYTESVAKALQELGYQVHTELYIGFYQQSSWVVQEMTKKLGFIFFFKKYYQGLNKRFINVWRQFQPDLCLIINGEAILPATLSLWKEQGTKLILWMVDTIKRPEMSRVNPAYYDRCYIFDPTDEEYIFNQFNKRSTYATLGYEPEIFVPNETVPKDIDISFIGAPTLNRKLILQKVAKYAFDNNKKLVIYSKCWKIKRFRRMPTSKKKFIEQFAPLHLYVENTTICPIAAAQVYRRSKICLNIHTAIHEGINPRTFEILGTKSFQIVDKKMQLKKWLTSGKDLIEYFNESDLIEKIDYYLKNDQLREKIAATGYNSVVTNCTMVHMVKKIAAEWKLSI